MAHPLPEETEAGEAGKGKNSHIQEFEELVMGSREPEEERDGGEGEGEDRSDRYGGEDEGQGLGEPQSGAEKQVEEVEGGETYHQGDEEENREFHRRRDRLEQPVGEAHHRPVDGEEDNGTYEHALYLSGNPIAVSYLVEEPPSVAQDPFDDVESLHASFPPLQLSNRPLNFLSTSPSLPISPTPGS